MNSQPAMLVYRVGQLGDTLVALPAIQAIAEKHPGCRLVLLTDRHATAKGYVSSWDVIGPTGWFAEVIFYHPRGLTALGKVRQWLAVIFRLRRYRFEQVYNLVMRTSQRAVQRDLYFFRYLIGAAEYVALAAIDYPPPRKPAGKLPRMMPEWMRLLKGIGVEANGSRFRLPLHGTAVREAAEVWPADETLLPQRFVVLAPGSKMDSKRWPEERFAAVGQHLLQHDPHLSLVIVGGTEDALLGERLCAAFAGRGVNLAGKLSIYGSAALMSRALLYVGNDTGTMHLAAMVGLPCVAIYSSRDYPGLWEPYGEKHVILREELECSGCMLEICEERAKACLLAITVEQVVAAIMERLDYS